MARQTDAVKRLVESELEKLTAPSASWHAHYAKSAYIYIGNLDPRLTEGDMITVFSQFGDIVDINLGRDKDTGKSLGFAFLAYENQKSTILAIDNMIGFPLLGRPLRVDHVLDYKPPKRYSETEVDSEGFPLRLPYEPTGAEGKGIGIHNVTESQRRLNMTGAAIYKMVNAVAKKEEDEDEAWARQFEKAMKNEVLMKEEI